MPDSTCTEEHSKLSEILNFRLPHSFKTIGTVGAVLIFSYLLAYKFFGSNTLVIKDVLRTLVLLFMLIACLSQDRIEDEYSQHIRFQSYLIAFVFAACYYILIPLISIVLDFVITRITGDGVVSFYEISAFEVLFTMLRSLKKVWTCITK